MRRILVVDDEEAIRRLYEAELREEGYEVLLASNGWEAIDRFVSFRPDLVILDIRMPEMDGLEVMGRMLAEDRRVPVILNSAYSSYRDNFLTWTADAYLVKCGDLSELKRTVRDLLFCGRSGRTYPRKPVKALSM